VLAKSRNKIRIYKTKGPPAGQGTGGFARRPRDRLEGTEEERTTGMQETRSKDGDAGGRTCISLNRG
jgi:hypothetical protein